MATIDNINGKYRVRIRKNNTVRTKTFSRHADAQAWAYKIESEIIDGLQGNAARNKTFGDLIDRYLTEVTPTKKGFRTEQYRLLRIKRTFLANINLTDLKPQDFATWRDVRLTEIIGESVIKELGVMSAICTVAMKEWGLMRDNPIRKITKPKGSAARTRRPTTNEIERLCLNLNYKPNVKPDLIVQRVAIAFLFAIETAMRAGEICALTWNDVDFIKRLAYIRTSKNGYPRDVPLSKCAIELLVQLKGIDNTSIFLIESASLDTLFRKAKKRCEIEDLHFHDSRREALTRMAKKVPVELLAKISGHRDLRILLNTYYAPDMANVADLLD